MSNSTKESRQRKFYRDLFPYHGQHIAANMGGFTPPSMDGQVAELKETFKLWQQVTASGADSRITESSWWMTMFMDPLRRASLPETMANHTQLTAFAVGVLGQLLSEGTVKWADENMVLPEIKIQAEDGSSYTDSEELSEDQMIDFARLLKQLEEDEA